jgi:hypothetical protein
MEKETAEMFEQRKNEWLKQKRILVAEEPQIPSLRLDHNTSAVLDEDCEGIWVKYAYDDGVDSDKSEIHIDKKTAIDMAHFIFELFGSEYSP